MLPSTLTLCAFYGHVLVDLACAMNPSPASEAWPHLSRGRTDVDPSARAGVAFRRGEHHVFVAKIRPFLRGPLCHWECTVKLYIFLDSQLSSITMTKMTVVPTWPGALRTRRWPQGALSGPSHFIALAATMPAPMHRNGKDPDKEPRSSPEARRCGAAGRVRMALPRRHGESAPGNRDVGAIGRRTQHSRATALEFVSSMRCAWTDAPRPAFRRDMGRALWDFGKHSRQSAPISASPFSSNGIIRNGRSG